MQTLNMAVDAEGIALVTLDDPAKSMNVVSPQLIDELIVVIDQVASDGAIRGAVITSGKPTFMAGADLNHILTLAGAIGIEEAYEFSQRPSMAMHRRMEICGKPFVAAINGLALGGGYELALACHHRVMTDDPKAVVGLPEVTVGLLPGSGGTQRLPRMIGMAKALPLLLEGKTVGSAEALELGLVDAVVPADRLLPTARRWILEGGEPLRAWDKKGYRPSGGLLDPSVAALTTTQPALIAAKTQRNYPAPITILDCVFEGAMMPFDKALALESKHFAKLLSGAVSRNLIRTSFVNRGALKKLARRPQDVATLKVGTVGVFGAGMMGSGIAQVAAAAGIRVILIDSTAALAVKGKAGVAKSLEKGVSRGQMTREAADALLARIEPTTDYAALSSCELVVEAVFEDPKIKASVMGKAQAVLAPDTILATNTSTLPITSLAQACARPEQFIGLHFFSPVERMPLVEVILGSKTSQPTLARALDFVAQLRMTPIIVNDSRGFYTSRVFQTFIHEGMRMLEDGVQPARIENAAKFVGFPVGPLALLDEVTVELPWKIVKETQSALGDRFNIPCAYEVMRRMVEEFKRLGRRHGGGFYDYPDNGGRRFWGGLAQAFPPKREQPDIEELQRRFLYIQGLETARCMEEGVVEHAADADVGSLLAWGFPAWTGGTLSLVETVGLQKFVAECERMAARYGPRFAPSAWLKERARNNRLFYAS